MKRVKLFSAAWMFVIVVLLALAPLAPTPASAASNASVRITMKSCDGTANPIDNPGSCQTVIEDDGIEYVWLPPNVSYYLLDSSRDANGSYYITGLTPNVNHYLSHFEPIKRQHMYVTGARYLPDNRQLPFVFQPVAGETIDIVLYYYDGAYAGSMADGRTHYATNSSSSSTSNGQSDVRVTMKTCPRGANPHQSTAMCSTVVSGDGMEYLLSLDTGRTYYLTDQTQLSNGTYVFRNLPDGAYEPHGFQPIKTDRVAVMGVTASGLIWVTDGYAEVTFYYYYMQ